LNQKRIYSRIKALFGVGERTERKGGARKKSDKESESPPRRVPTPESHEEAPIEPSQPPRRAKSLRSRLQRELDKGVAMERRVAHPLGFAGASVLMGPPTRQEDVDAWEARVERLLRDLPRSLSLFRYNEPTSGFARLMVNPLDNPLRDRLRRRNIQLEKIIRDL
jgi:hypothetical protein